MLMASFRRSWWKIFALWLFSKWSGVRAEIALNATVELDLVKDVGDILCSFRPKSIYVYFGNETSLGYPGQILQELSDCSVSYISMRKQYHKTPIEVIKDDGILMYLVIVLHDASQPLELSIIKKKSAAKHLSHVLLLIEDARTVTRLWMRNTFVKFWRIWLLNVVIVYWRHGQLQVYRYNPFMDDFLIEVFYDGRLPGHGDLFPTRLPDMMGKPLRVCYYADEIRAIFGRRGLLTGSDGLMSGYIAERLNATRIVNRVNVLRNLNGSTEPCLHEAEHEIDDIAMNVRFLSLATFDKRVEHTIVHNRDDLCVLVPKARVASTFWNLVRSFQAGVWLPTVLSIPVAYGFCLLVYGGRWRFSRHILLDLFAGILTMPLTRVPLRNAMRLFLFLWLIYGVLICSAFRGNLMSNLVFRKYLPDVNTIRDLALSPYNLLLFARHEKHLQNFLNTSCRFEAIIKRKMIIVQDEILLRHVRSNNATYAYLEKYHVAKFQSQERRHMRRGRPLYHVMTTCLVPFHAVFIVPYGSPYLGFVNTLVRNSREFGFLHHWERQMNDVFRKSGKRIIRSQRNEDDPVVLQLPHFQATFFLWAIGLAVASFAFLGELLWQRDFKDLWSKLMQRNSN